MPFFLVVPPPTFVGIAPEPALALQKDAAAREAAALRELSAGAAPVATISLGAFRGARLFSWSRDFDAILHVTAIATPGKAPRWATALVRHDNCHFLGARWQTSEASALGTPLAEAAGRSFRSVNPHRYVLHFSKELSKNEESFFAIIADDDLARRGMPVVSSVGRAHCEVNWRRMASVAQEKGKAPPLPRAHRLVTLNLQGKTQGNEVRVTGTAMLTSGVFANLGQQLAAIQNPVRFDAESLARAINDTIVREAHVLDPVSFKVSRREGRFVYLERGRAYGLQIGMHLVGPGDSKLHVIRFFPETREIDMAIALIRREDAAAPLKAGDEISIDPTLYPKSP